MFLRFSRYRFRDGAEAEGLEILQRHARLIASAPGCQHAWLGQGQHPAYEFVLIALFDDEGALRAFEGRLRSDPKSGGDSFALLRLARQPPEETHYEVRSAVRGSD